MRRRRHIPILLTSTLLVVVVSLWIRSHWRLDLFSRVREDGTSRAVFSYQGALHLVSAGTNGRPRTVRWDVYRIESGATYATVHRIGAVQWEQFGFARVKTTPTVTVAIPGGGAVVATTQRFVTVVIPAGGTLTLPYGPSAVPQLTPWLQAPPYDALIVPYWPIALLAGVYPAVRTSRLVRAAIRRRQGRCPACGYDLRASPDRCPECGSGRDDARDNATAPA